jgi:hypothetical protein
MRAMRSRMEPDRVGSQAPPQLLGVPERLQYDLAIRRHGLIANSVFGATADRKQKETTAAARAPPRSPLSTTPSPESLATMPTMRLRATLRARNASDGRGPRRRISRAASLEPAGALRQTAGLLMTGHSINRMGVNRKDWTPLEARRCFVCGCYETCVHREPELLVRREVLNEKSERQAAQDSLKGGPGVRSPAPGR